MDKIYNEYKLIEKEIQIIENDSEGNCYYRVQRFFNTLENYHIYFLKELTLYIETKKIELFNL